MSENLPTCCNGDDKGTCCPGPTTTPAPRVSEQQALGLSDIAHGVGVDFIHPRTLSSLRGSHLVFQREDGSWGLTDKGHDAFNAAATRWPVLLADDYRRAALINAAPALLAEVSELRATVARMEALRADLSAADEHGNPLREGSFGEAADELRAALASPTSHAQREAEVGARVLLRILDRNGEGRGMVCARLLDAADRVENPSHRGNRFRWPEHARMFRDLADALAAEAGGE